MVLNEIDSKQFRDMVRVATHRIGKNAEFVNSLNVFPVPDGDTGTNMNLTIESGAKAVSETLRPLMSLYKALRYLTNNTSGGFK